MGQVVTQDDIVKIVSEGHKNGKTFVITNGCFDILHLGHAKYLSQTKELADYSIILLNSDKSVRELKGDGRPVNNENDRAEMLTFLSSVDYVVIFEEKSPSVLIDRIKPDIYTKGGDYTIENLPERDVIRKNNIRVKFIDFVEGKSTTQILGKINKNNNI